MAEDESLVRIVSWPTEPARVEHRMQFEEPCPVSVSFERTPATVVVQTAPERPLDVRMAMDVSAERPLPICISVCEPICAESNYTVGIEIFDRPVMTITVRGITRLFNCRDEGPR
jgi:hypothetical protein